MNTGLLSSLLEMVVLGHGIGIGRITVSKRILIVVSSYSVSLFACWFVYSKLGCLSWFDCFEQTYLNAYGMECLRMKKIFPTCLMKQPPSRLAGIWLTMSLIVVSFPLILRLFPLSCDIILLVCPIQWMVPFSLF